MACFIVPMTQAVGLRVFTRLRSNRTARTTVMRKRLKKENSSNPRLVNLACPEPVEGNPWISQLPKLELMLWGGTVMLIIDHILNGELTWQYPFFTAMEREDGIMTMLQEMITVGLPMSLSVTMIYCIMVAWTKCMVKEVTNPEGRQ